jgi:hypothetical protein
VSTRQMHPGMHVIDDDLVRRLITGQFPQWAGLAVRRWPSGGTVNAMYRLGGDMVIRLPLVQGGAGDVLLEREWLPRLAPHLPTRIPEVLGAGEPAPGYPWPWSVYRWLVGDHPEPGVLSEPVLLAGDLAAFVAAMRSIPLPGAPRAHRGGPVASLDADTRAAIRELRGIPEEDVDCDAAALVWEQALQAAGWDGPPVWLHADLMPGNLLTDGGRLASVIDFGCVGGGRSGLRSVPGVESAAGRCEGGLPRGAGRGRRDLDPRPGADTLAGADRAAVLPQDQSRDGAQRPARDSGRAGRRLRPGSQPQLPAMPPEGRESGTVRPGRARISRASSRLWWPGRRG